MGTCFPSELSYLREAARRFGPAEGYWANDGRVERDGEAWRTLAEIHNAMAQREDAVVIARWLAEPSQSAADRDERNQLRGLLRLLRRLGKKGVRPFDQPVFRLPRLREMSAGKDAKSNLSKRIPARLRYVVARAERLGIRPRWHRLGEFIDAAGERRFNALAATADRMRRRGDDRLLRKWLGGRPNAPSRDAALARGLLHVLDALEIF